MSSDLPFRHRGTWATITLILLLALGVCAIVFGVFSFPESLHQGLTSILFGLGLIFPGLWWLRWYHKPNLFKYTLALSAFFIISGTFFKFFRFT